MSKARPQRTPEEIFTEAVSEDGHILSSGDLRLLVSGLSALRGAHEKPLNEIERHALSGMIAYVAYTQDVDEATVCEILAAHFGVAEVGALPSRLYQDSIEFLVDLEMKKIVN